MNKAQNNIPIHFLYLTAICAATILAYSNSFLGQFTLDDFINILNDRRITDFDITISGIIDAATSGRNGGRWLPNLSFGFNYLAHGDNVWGYHLVNLLVHIAGAIILYSLSLTTLNLPALSKQFINKNEIAFIATLLWAVHPLQTNAVTYIVQRMTSMAALFYMSSLLCYVQGRIAERRGMKQIVLFGLSFLFGFMAIKSKENAYMIPVMIFAYELFFLNTSSWIKDYKKILAWLAACLSIILLCTVLFLGGAKIISHIIEVYGYRDFTMLQRLLTETRIFFLYLSLLALPLPSRLNLNHDIPISYGIFTPFQTSIALAGVILFVWLIFYLYNRDRLLSFGLFWFLGNLLLESTFVPLELIFEHRLYLPSSFLILGLTATACVIMKRKTLFLRATYLLLIFLFCTWTWQRNQVWTSNVRLWSDVVSKSPGLARGHNNLGVALHEQGQFHEAENSFIQAIKVNPESRLGYQSLGSLYISQNRLEEAQRILRTGLSKETFLSPGRIYHYLGIIERKAGRYQQAINYAQMALNLDKNSLEPLLTIGITYGKLGDPQKADAVFRKAENQGMRSVDLFNNSGIIAFQLGQVERSLQYFNKALEIDPDHPESHNNLGLAYGKLGRVEDARKEMETAMRLKQQKKP